MRRTILLLCVVSVLAWAAGTVLAQGQDQGKGKDQGIPVANPNKPAEAAKVDVNAPAAKKAPAMQDIQKGAREKAKGLMEQAQQQGQTRGKAMKDQVAGKLGETKAKGQEQQVKAREMQAQRDTAKHMDRQARLQRIRELAVQKGDTKMVAQVDQLIAKENQLYDLKLKKAQGLTRPAGLPQGMGAQGKVDVNKPAENKPAVQTPPPAPAPPAPAPVAPAPAAPAQAAPAPAAPAPEKPAEAPKPQ
jgi:2-oxoglutarate dehydrogenase E2 component (dihydrolipoamide succinyltransferase)